MPETRRWCRVFRRGMTRNTRTPILLATTGVALALALSGCSGSGTAPVGVATTTVTAAPTSSASSSAPSTGSSSAGGAASSGTTSPSTGSAASGSAAGSGSGSAASRCAAASLAGSIEPGSGGAAGSTIVHLALRNTGSTTCTLQGWPGVSFVGGSNGTQIGNAASEDRTSAHPTVTLAPGATAVAPLRITDTANYPAGECDPASADGLRVYPPGSRQSLFVRYTEAAACRSTSVTELQVQALVPEGQAAD